MQERLLLELLDYRVANKSSPKLPSLEQYLKVQFLFVILCKFVITKRKYIKPNSMPKRTLKSPVIPLNTTLEISESIFQSMKTKIK